MNKLDKMSQNGATKLLKTIYNYAIDKKPEVTKQEIENITLDIMMATTFANGTDSPKALLSNYPINSEIQKVLILFLKQRIIKSKNLLTKFTFKSTNKSSVQKIIEKIVSNEKFLFNKKSFILNEVRKNYIYWTTIINERKISKRAYIYIMNN